MPSTGKRRPIGAIAAVACAVLAAGAVGISFLGAWSSIFDLLAHFRVQLTAACAALCALLLPRRGLRAAGILPGIAAVAGLASIAPLYVPAEAEPDPASSRLTIYAHNTWGRSNEIDQVLGQVSEIAAQLNFLQEMSRALRPNIAALEDAFDVIAHRENALLVAKSARGHFEIEDAQPWSEDAWLGFDVHARLDGRPLRILAVHLSSPRTMRGLERRDRQLQAIRRWSEANHEPQLVIGDLNTTPWGYGFRSLLRETRLLDSTTGFGLQPTYPCFGPAGLTLPIRIPIDHALHTPELVTIDRRIEAAAGSNHRPLRLVLAWREPAASASRSVP